MIELDGSNGGGQILRTALGLSAITKKPFHMLNIRESRKNPGLKQQHLECVQAFKKLCNAEVTGDYLGSKELTFDPGTFKPQKIDIDIQTAGSITLLLQSIFIPALYADKKTTLTIKGGTDVSWSMPSEYVKQVLIPQLKRYAKIEFIIKKRGYQPKGQGIIEVDIIPVEKTHQIILPKQEELLAIKGQVYSAMSLQKRTVAERIQYGAETILQSTGCPIEIKTEYSETASDGCGITMWSIHGTEERDMNNPIILGVDELGELHTSAEEVGKRCARKLLEEIKSGAAVDKHCADNLIPYLGIFGGKIKTSEITNHIRTNVAVTEKFLNVTFVLHEETKEIAVPTPYLVQYRS